MAINAEEIEEPSRSISGENLQIKWTEYMGLPQNEKNKAGGFAKWMESQREVPPQTKQTPEKEVDKTGVIDKLQKVVGLSSKQVKEVEALNQQLKKDGLADNQRADEVREKIKELAALNTKPMEGEKKSKIEEITLRNPNQVMDYVDPQTQALVFNLTKDGYLNLLKHIENNVFSIRDNNISQLVVFVNEGLANFLKNDGLASRSLEEGVADRSLATQALELQKSMRILNDTLNKLNPDLNQGFSISFKIIDSDLPKEDRARLLNEAVVSNYVKENKAGKSAVIIESEDPNNAGLVEEMAEGLGIERLKSIKLEQRHTATPLSQAA